MPKLGILFNIDELGDGLYGYEAYKILFNSIDSRQLAGCTLYDGDTNETLRGGASHYCIAIESSDSRVLENAKKLVSECEESGLLPPASRFMSDAAVRIERLVLAAKINSAGEPVGDKSGWVTSAYKTSIDRSQTVGTLDDNHNADSIHPGEKIPQKLNKVPIFGLSMKRAILFSLFLLIVVFLAWFVWRKNHVQIVTLKSLGISMSLNSLLNTSGSGGFSDKKYLGYIIVTTEEGKEMEVDWPEKSFFDMTGGKVTGGMKLQIEKDKNVNKWEVVKIVEK